MLPSPAQSGDFLDASMVLEFDLKPQVAEVNQALDLGEAHGLKSPEIGPRPLQVYQKSRERLPKPNKSRVVIFSGSDRTGNGVCDWDLTGSAMVSVSGDYRDEASGLGPDFPASPSADAGTPVISTADSVVQGKFFSFSPVISAAAPYFLCSCYSFLGFQVCSKQGCYSIV